MKIVLMAKVGGKPETNDFLCEIEMPNPAEVVVRASDDPCEIRVFKHIGEDSGKPVYREVNHAWLPNWWTPLPK